MTIKFNIIARNCQKMQSKTLELLFDLKPDTIILMQEANLTCIASQDTKNYTFITHNLTVTAALRSSIMTTHKLGNSTIANLVKVNGKKLLLLNIYINPATKQYDLMQLLDGIVKIRRRYIDLPTIIQGDFNSQLDIWTPNFVLQTPRAILIREMLDKCEVSLPYHPLPRYYTFRHHNDTTSHIDALLVSKKVKAEVTIITSDRDHSTFKATCNIEESHVSLGPSVATSKPEKIMCKKKYLSLLNSFLSEKYEFKTINDIESFTYDFFKFALLAQKASATYTKKVNLKKQLMSHGMKIKLRKLVTKYNKTKNSNVKQQIMNTKMRIQDIMKLRIAEKFSTQNAKSLWRNIKELILSANRQETMEEFIQSRQKIQNEFNLNLENIEIVNHSPQQPALNSHIPLDLSKVLKSFSKLDDSSPGPDSLTKNETLSLFNKHENLFVSLYSSCLVWSHFPMTWKITKTVIIPKSDGKRARLIQMQSFISKTLEKMIAEIISEQISEKTFCLQHAYLPDKSTITAIDNLLYPFIENTNLRKGNFILQTDISGAFDEIHHEAILMNCLKYGVKQNIIKILISYLSNRHTMITHPQTKFKRQIKGVPQGSILGPLLFNIGINEALTEISKISPPYFDLEGKKYPRPMPEFAPKITVTAYADDLFICFLLTRVSIPRLKNTLTYIYENIDKALLTTRLKISVEKTKIISNQPDFTNNRAIPNLESKAIILGLPIDLTRRSKLFLDEETYFENFRQKQKQYNFPIYLFSKLPPKIQRMISNTYIESHLTGLSPFLLPSLLTSKKFNKALNTSAGILMDKAIKLKSFDRRYPSYLITNNIPVNLKILEIALKYVCSNLNRQSAIKEWLTVNKPELLPNPIFGNEFIPWPKRIKTETSKLHLSSPEYTTPGASNHLILKLGLETGFNTMSYKTRQILGAYNFLTKNKQCICGQAQSPDNIHFLFHCTYLDGQRNFLKSVGQRFGLSLKDLLLKKPDIAEKLFREIQNIITLISENELRT